MSDATATLNAPLHTATTAPEGQAPQVQTLDGVLHPKEVMDTLGVDEAESACRQRP